jgi:hypothetical protein
MLEIKKWILYKVHIESEKYVEYIGFEFKDLWYLKPGSWGILS